MNLGNNKEEALGTILSVLVKRMGGEVTITQDELDEVDGTNLVATPDDRTGKLTVTLIPAYVKIGEEEPEPLAFKYIASNTTNTSGSYVPNSVRVYTSDLSNGSTLTFNTTYDIT